MGNHEARQRTKTRTASISRPRRSVSAIALSRSAVVENVSIPGWPHNLGPRRHRGMHTPTKTHATHDYTVTCCLPIDMGGTSIGSPPARIAARMLLGSTGTPAKNKLLRLQGFSASRRCPLNHRTRPRYASHLSTFLSDSADFSRIFAAAGRDSETTTPCKALKVPDRDTTIHQAIYAERSARCPLDAHYW
jgi:hypothetical protein